MEPTAVSPPEQTQQAPPAPQSDSATHVVDAIPAAVLILDSTGNVTFANAPAAAIFDQPADKLPGRAFSSLLSEPFKTPYAEAIRAFAEGTEPEDLIGTREVVGLLADGSTIALDLTMSEMRDGDNRLLVATARDIREQKRDEARLRHEAEHDPLTGLPNRTSFEQILTRHVEYAARYGNSGSVVAVGIDNFKYVNETVGHEGGDELLRQLTELLTNRLRKTDILARLGGDIFAMLLHGAGEVKAQEVAAEVVKLIEGHVFVIDAEQVRITISAGLTALEERPVTGAELLAESDVAMYRAKEAGRNQVVTFEPEGPDGKETKRVWSERVRQATERGLFVLVCQPIMDMETREVTRYELLLRMRGEDGGLVEPGAFLATAERFGLIQGVDRWVTQQAMRLIAAHKQEGRALTLGINLSGQTMSGSNKENFVAQVSKDLKSTGIDPSSLVFEITETAAVDDIEVARSFAEALRELGCQVALDDFGAGFASFYYLKHLPFDYLKIDGEFIKELPRAPIDQLIVKALVDVCKGREIKTVGEFVGDEDTMDALKRLGVDYAQGYHIGKPVPVAELRASAGDSGSA